MDGHGVAHGVQTKWSAGSGQLHLSNPASARFASLRASYPLKLLAPDRLPSQPANIATAYMLAYGGGLVAGDVVSLQVDVDAGCGVVLLTQGSTKVFKHRPGIRPLSHQIIRAAAGDVTRQRLVVRLGHGSMCMLMPDSVSPFRSSRYSQVQRFVLPKNRSASLLVLDWVNSGRGWRGPGRTFGDEDREVWAMGHYGSTNEVVIGKEMVMRERLVLEGGNALAPYHVYGTLIIIGPAFASLVAYLAALCDHTSQMQIHTPPSLLWSWSPTDPQGGVLRIAAEEVEDAKRWLREVMTFAGVQHVVGEGLWPRVI